MRGRRAALAGFSLALVALGLGGCSRTSLTFQPCNMYPTIQPGDGITLDTPRAPIVRGEIVEFRLPPLASARGLAISRVVGLPGETISFVGGKVDIDGKPLAQPYLPRGTTTELPAGGSTVFPPGVTSLYIPPHTYFVMGDNRGDSEDSREFGPIGGPTIVASVGSFSPGPRNQSCPR
jgi:signal peptidase I